MPRPQFTLKTLLWLMACAACFSAGVVSKTALERHELAADQRRRIPGVCLREDGQFVITIVDRDDGESEVVVPPVQIMPTSQARQ